MAFPNICGKSEGPHDHANIVYFHKQFDGLCHFLTTACIRLSGIKIITRLLDCCIIVSFSDL